MVARRILGKNPTSTMAIAGLKLYLQLPPGLIKNRAASPRFVFHARMDRKARRPRLEAAYPRANHDEVWRGHRIFGQNHPLLSWPGRDYIALQQQGSAHCTGA
jgi:hypothetical protein